MRALTTVLLAALGVLASAQLYPDRPDKTYVADEAHVMTAAEVREITTLARNRIHTLGAPVVVATIPSLKEMHAVSLGIDKYAQRMFDTWRIGSQQDNVGILLVVSKGDRKARIEFGRRFNHEFDGDAHAIMNSTIVPAFKRGAYGESIVGGMRQLDKLGRNPPATDVPPSSGSVEYQSGPIPPPSFSGFPNPPAEMAALVFMPFLCFGAVFLIGFIMVVRLVRRAGQNARTGGPRPGSFGGNRTWSNDDAWQANRMRQEAMQRDMWQQQQDRDDAFTTGFVAGSIGNSYDPTPPDTSWTDNSTWNNDSSSGFDSSSSSGFDSGSSSSDSSSSSSSDSGSSFDSGSSGGGGDTGSW